MGDPKKPRRKYESPRHPWSTDLLSQELYLLGTYGLRNKREIRRTVTELSRVRKQARLLLAAPLEVRAREEQRLLASLSKRGVIGPSATLDDVLSLTIENFLERRLQTLVWKKGISVSPHQARQMITHGHVKVGECVVTVPGYIVSTEEEEGLRLREESPLVKTAAPG